MIPYTVDQRRYEIVNNPCDFSAFQSLSSGMGPHPYMYVYYVEVKYQRDPPGISKSNAVVSITSLMWWYCGNCLQIFTMESLWSYKILMTQHFCWAGDPFVPSLIVDVWLLTY